MDKCYLDHIAVDAQFRGRGIGTVLMEKAEQEARARGCSVSFCLFERLFYVPAMVMSGLCLHFIGLSQN